MKGCIFSHPSVAHGKLKSHSDHAAYARFLSKMQTFMTILTIYVYFFLPSLATQIELLHNDSVGSFLCTQCARNVPI